MFEFFFSKFTIIFSAYLIELSNKLLIHLVIKFFLPLKKIFLLILLSIFAFSYFEIISSVMLLSSIILFKKKEVEITNNEAD